MKKIFYFLIFSLLFPVFLVAKADIQNYSYYVKFISENPRLISEKDNSISANLKIRPLINSNFNSKDNLIQSQNLRLSELKKVFIIEIDEFSSELIDFLSKSNEVEYIEKVPKRYIVATNDSLIDKQWHLDTIKINEVRQFIDMDKLSEIKVAIVDTGIDYEHPDLKDNIWINLGETGLDENGNDKATNGIDDDGNGYVDDWRGWDFNSSDESGQDNDATYGNLHGVHVSGIVSAVVDNEIGVSSVAGNCKLIPIKIGPDLATSVSVANGIDGILYAALVGADIINCSWGSMSGFSYTEQEVINLVTDMGSLVVAAAGNNNRDTKFYPASYSRVMSVASSDDRNRKSSFSNYNYDIDILAPGSFILSTMPNEEYDFLSGTSMASPVVAGVAALVKSTYNNLNPREIKALLKENTDNPYGGANLIFKNKLGRGLINALKAVSTEKNIAIELDSISILTGNQSNELLLNDEFTLNLHFFNPLTEINNIQIVFNNDQFIPLDIISADFSITSAAKNEEFNTGQSFRFRIPENTPTDYIFTVSFVFNADNYKNEYFLSFKSNPSFRTMRANNIYATFNSISNLAYNNFPSNSEGEGFGLKGESSILFESSFMATNNNNYVANTARNEWGSSQDRFWKMNKPIILSENTIYKYSETEYTDFQEISASPNDSLALKLKVKQRAYQYKNSELSNSIIIIYDMINESMESIDSVFAGLFFDWDISNPADKDYAYFDTDIQAAITVSDDDSREIASIVKILNPGQIHYWAIDNDGGGFENPGIYDGFTSDEKYLMLSSGIGREKSSITDVSMVIGAGPLYINLRDTTSLSFLIHLDKKGNIINSYNEAITFLEKNNLESIPNYFEGRSFSLIYPNPANNQISLEFTKYEAEPFTINVYNVKGMKVMERFYNASLFVGKTKVELDISTLSTGKYFIELVSGNKRLIGDFIKVRD